MDYAKSWTVYGAALLAAVKIFEASGIAPMGVSDSLMQVAQAVGTFLAIVGIRRALPGPAKPTA